MAGINTSGLDNLAEIDNRSQMARDRIDMGNIRARQFLPRSRESWHNQYMYTSEDRYGQVIPLTGEKIDSLLISPVYGQQAHINGRFIKKCVILADALFLPEFINPFLIKCQAGTFLDIFPHSYVVPSNFVEIC